MNINNKLRNKLIGKIRQLSSDKLSEVSKMLSKIEDKIKSKDKTLQLAGTWGDLDDDIFTDLTDRLHDNRTNDRQII